MDMEAAVKAPDPMRRTLTPRERSRAALAAMEALDPIFHGLSNETRVAILKDLQAEYTARAATNGARPGPRRKP